MKPFFYIFEALRIGDIVNNKCGDCSSVKSILLYPKAKIVTHEWLRGIVLVQLKKLEQHWLSPVSQIWILILMSPFKVISPCPNSTPIVALLSDENSLEVNRVIIFVFPTLLSPTTTTRILEIILANFCIKTNNFRHQFEWGRLPLRNFKNKVSFVV